MEIALRSAGNNGAADFERVLTSMVESSVLHTVLVAAKSLLRLLALTEMGSLSHETNTLGTEAEVMTG
ncbi:uncharacterized protein A4U43_C01F1090 [Asparagus officinalis]|uniref:Uncharacterized protein n=2 Tax=Asparagus officinalis TaxID=4686 RepID=A0A5P1FL33_ASPOF|nr:uncharacterized protein A4U43_C01F1090 [Asparagus officinalis]